MFPHDGATPESVLTALGDMRFEVRCQALELLERRAVARPDLSLLLPLVEDPAWQVRSAAARALSVLGRGEPSVGRALLSRALHDNHLWVRHAALAGLESLALPFEALEAPLLEALAGDSSALPCLRALQALGRLRLVSEPALEALVSALTSANWEARAEALRALGASGRSTPRVLRAVTAALGDTDSSVRGAACEALARLSPLGDAEVAALGRLVSDPEPAVRIACARALGQLPSRAHRQALRVLLRDPDERVREAVVLVVGSGGLDHPSQWAEFLEDPSVLVRQAAKSFLADGELAERAGVTDPSSLEPLASALLGLRDVNARDAIANLVAQDEPLGLPYLLEGLRHPRVRIRHRAARALGFFILHSDVAARGVRLLGEALRDPSERVRCVATESLGRVGRPALPTYPGLLRRVFEQSTLVPERARQVVQELRGALPADWMVLESPRETAESLFLRWVAHLGARSPLTEETLLGLCLARERWHLQFCRTPPAPSVMAAATVREAAERAAQAAIAHGTSRRRGVRPDEAPRDREREFAWLLGRLHALVMAERVPPLTPGDSR